MQKIIDQKGNLIIDHEPRSCASGDGCHSTKDQCSDETTRVAKAVSQAMANQEVVSKATPAHNGDVGIKKGNTPESPAAAPAPPPAVSTEAATTPLTATAAGAATYAVEHISTFWTQARIEMLVKVTPTIQLACTHTKCTCIAQVMSASQVSAHSTLSTIHVTHSIV